jgi:hypothetical protein
MANTRNRYVVLHNMNSGKYIPALATDKRVNSKLWSTVSSHVSRNAAVNASEKAARTAAKPSKPPSTKPIVNPDKKTGRPRKKPTTPPSEIVPGQGESNRRPFQPKPEPAPEPPKKAPRPVTTSLEKGVSGTTVFNPKGELKKTKWWLIQNQKTGSFKSISNKAKIPSGWDRYGNSTFGKKKNATARISDLRDAGLNTVEPKSRIGSGKLGAMTAADKFRGIAGDVAKTAGRYAKTAGRVLGGTASTLLGPSAELGYLLAADDPSSDEKVVGTDFPKAWNKITALLKKHGDTRDIRELPKGIKPGTSSQSLKEQLQSYARHATSNLDSEHSKGIPKIEASLTNALSASTGRQQEKGRETAAQMELTRKARNARYNQSRKERAAADTTEFTETPPPRKPGKTIRGARGFEAVSGETPFRGGEPVERQGRRSKRMDATRADDVGIEKAKREKRASVAAGADNIGVERARQKIARRTAAETLGGAEGPRPVSPLRPGVPSGDAIPGSSQDNLPKKREEYDPGPETFKVSRKGKPSAMWWHSGKATTEADPLSEDTTPQELAQTRRDSRARAALKGMKSQTGGGATQTKRPTVTPAPVETTAPSSPGGQDIEFDAQKAKEAARAGMGHPARGKLPSKSATAKSSRPAQDLRMSAVTDDKSFPGGPAIPSSDKHFPKQVAPEKLGPAPYEKIAPIGGRYSQAQVNASIAKDKAGQAQAQKDKNLSAFFRGKQQLDDSTIQPRFELGGLGKRKAGDPSDPIPEFSKKKGPGAIGTTKAPTPSQKEVISGAIKELRAAPGGERKRVRKPAADLGRRGRKYEATDAQEREWEEMQRKAEMLGQRKGGEIKKKKKATKAPAKKQYAHSHRARPKNPTISKTSYNY